MRWSPENVREQIVGSSSELFGKKLLVEPKCVCSSRHLRSPSLFASVKDIVAAERSELI